MDTGFTPCPCPRPRHDFRKTPCPCPRHDFRKFLCPCPRPRHDFPKPPCPCPRHGLKKRVQNIVPALKFGSPVKWTVFWRKLDGPSKNGLSFRKWTVPQKVDGPTESGRSVRKWTVQRVKVDGPKDESENERSQGCTWMIQRMKADVPNNQSQYTVGLNIYSSRRLTQYKSP